MSDTIDSAVIDALSRPIEQARGLPNHAFTDPAFLELENHTLFADNWVFIGRQSELPNAGDVVQTHLAGNPILITRDSNHDINVFHNVCPHRGAKLVGENRSEARLLTCPYHAWSFSLDGRLLGRPHFNGPGQHTKPASEDCPELFRIRHGCWHDAIFVNLNGNASPLMEYLAPLQRQSAGFDISAFNYSATLTSQFDCNWKLAIENWSDVYHVFHVHPTLNRMMDNSHRTGMLTDENLIYCRWGYDQATLDAESFPLVEQLDNTGTRTSFNGHLFPGLGISFHPTMFLIWDFKPVTHANTTMNLHLYFVGESATDDQHAEFRQQRFDYYADLNREDEEVCRRIQLGRAARGFDGGRFSPYWDAGTLHLARLVANAVDEKVR